MCFQTLDAQTATLEDLEFTGTFSMAYHKDAIITVSLDGVHNIRLSGDFFFMFYASLLQCGTKQSYMAQNLRKRTLGAKIRKSVVFFLLKK